MIGGKVGVTRTILPIFTKKSRLMSADTFAPSTRRPAEPALPAGDQTAGGIASCASSSMSVVHERLRSLAASPLWWLLVATLAVRIVGLDRPLVGTFAT